MSHINIIEKNKLKRSVLVIASSVVLLVALIICGFKIYFDPPISVIKMEANVLNILYNPLLLPQDSLYQTIKKDPIKKEIYKKLTEMVYQKEKQKYENLGIYCKLDLKGISYSEKRDTVFIQIRAWRSVPQYYYYYWFNRKDLSEKLTEK